MKKGFSLIELMGTIALMTVLVLLVVPNVVKMFNEATKKIMITEQGNFKSAVELYVQDYCIDPNYDPSGSINVCPTVYKNNNYVCLSTIQNLSPDPYIGSIIYKKQPCKGVAVFDKTSGKITSKGVSVYLRCMDETNTTVLYETDPSFNYSLYNSCF